MKEDFMRRVNASHPFFAAPLVVLTISVFVLFIQFVNVENMGKTAVYAVMLALQTAVFGIPAAIFCFFRGQGYIFKLGFGLPRKKSLPVIVFGTLFFILSICVLKFGLFHFAYDATAYSLYGSSISIRPSSFGSGLIMVLSLAAFPALLEELVFRGIVMHEYRMCGSFFSMIMSALLFAFVHFDLPQFPIYFVSGLILAWLVFLTKSVWASVIAHFAYNIFALFWEKYVWLFSSNPDSDILFWLILIAILLVCAFFFLSFAERLLRSHAERGEPAQRPVPKNKIALMLFDVFTSLPLLGEALLFLVFGIIALF